MDDRRSTLLQASLLRLVRRGAWGDARKLIEKSHPADVAHVLDRVTDADRQQVFDLISSDDARAEVVSHLEFARRADLLRGLEPPAAARIVRGMSIDDAAEALRELLPEQADQILSELGEAAAEVESLLGYPESTAGSIMSPEFFALPDTATVQAAIEKLQETRELEPDFYCYVVDERNHLVGVLSLRQLIMHRPETPLRDCMSTDPIRRPARLALCPQRRSRTRNLPFMLIGLVLLGACSDGGSSGSVEAVPFTVWPRFRRDGQNRGQATVRMAAASARLSSCSRDRKNRNAGKMAAAPKRVESSASVK